MNQPVGFDYYDVARYVTSRDRSHQAESVAGRVVEIRNTTRSRVTVAHALCASLSSWAHGKMCHGCA